MSHQNAIDAIRFLNLRRDQLSDPNLVDVIVRRFGLLQYEAEELIELVKGKP